MTHGLDPQPQHPATPSPACGRPGMHPTLRAWGGPRTRPGHAPPQPPPPGVALPRLGPHPPLLTSAAVTTLASCPVMAVPASTPSLASLPRSLWGVWPHCPERTWSWALAWALVSPTARRGVWVGRGLGSPSGQGTGGPGPVSPALGHTQVQAAAGGRASAQSGGCPARPRPHLAGRRGEEVPGVRLSKGWQRERACQGARCVCLLATCPVLTGQLAACART